MILLNPSCGANQNHSRHNHHLGPQTVSSLPDLTQMLPQKHQRKETESEFDPNSSGTGYIHQAHMIAVQVCLRDLGCYV